MLAVVPGPVQIQLAVGDKLARPVQVIADGTGGAKRGKEC